MQYDEFTPEEMGYDFNDGLTGHNSGGKNTLDVNGRETSFKMEFMAEVYDDPKLIFSQQRDQMTL